MANCTPWTITKVMALDSGGNEKAPKDGDGLGRRYYSTSPDGKTTVPQTEPPPGWKPRGKGDHELRLYGYHPRPVDPERAAEWDAAADRFDGFGDPGFCSTGRSNGSTSYYHIRLGTETSAVP